MAFTVGQYFSFDLSFKLKPLSGKAVTASEYKSNSSSTKGNSVLSCERKAVFWHADGIHAHVLSGGWACSWPLISDTQLALASLWVDSPRVALTNSNFPPKVSLLLLILGDIGRHVGKGIRLFRELPSFMAETRGQGGFNFIPLGKSGTENVVCMFMVMTDKIQSVK